MKITYTHFPFLIWSHTFFLLNIVTTSAVCRLSRRSTLISIIGYGRATELGAGVGPPCPSRRLHFTNIHVVAFYNTLILLNIQTWHHDFGWEPQSITIFLFPIIIYGFVCIYMYALCVCMYVYIISTAATITTEVVDIKLIIIILVSI